MPNGCYGLTRDMRADADRVAGAFARTIKRWQESGEQSRCSGWRRRASRRHPRTTTTEGNSRMVPRRHAEPVDRQPMRRTGAAHGQHRLRPSHQVARPQVSHHARKHRPLARAPLCRARDRLVLDGAGGDGARHERAPPRRPGGPELMRRRLLRTWAPAAPRGCSRGRITLAEYGRPVQKRRKRARPCRAGCHSPRRPAHLPDDGPVMPREKEGARGGPEGTGEQRPAAGGERTLMGPAARLPLRAPKARDPHAVQVLKRTNERKLAGLANDLAGPKRDPRRVRERQDSKLKHAADRRSAALSPIESVRNTAPYTPAHQATSDAPPATPSQILEAARLEKRVVELTALQLAHLR